MQIYVGITDAEWYQYLKAKNAKEVNFWRPGSSTFKAIKENDLFLFKLHAPQNFIVGGGFFVKYSYLPTFLAWEAFGEKNGTSSLDKLNSKIRGYRERNNMNMANPEIGCIILTDVFYFDRDDWIPAPASFSKSIVQGKSYDTKNPEGAELYNAVTNRLKINIDYESGNRYTESLTKHRIGQGAFRIEVTDAYQRRCAISGEKTLPVLEACHIKPFAEDGPNEVDNGILLKSDFHTPFDAGYITVDDHYRVDVSDRLHEDYGNGKDYYKYKGKQLLILPGIATQRPAKKFLEWHNEHVFLG